VCEFRYGRSQLGDVIRQGVDPHCYTAALIRKTSLDDFMALSLDGMNRISDQLGF